MTTRTRITSGTWLTEASERNSSGSAGILLYRKGEWIVEDITRECVFWK